MNSNSNNYYNYYSMYNIDSGMNTKIWGPCLWDFLFISILGRYPSKIDNTNNEHLQIKESFKATLLNLQIILPCVFCRNSYKTFMEDLPIDSFLIGKIELMYWLYLIKDKVNKKLIKQEKEMYQKLSNGGGGGGGVQLEKESIFCTVSSPPFIEVIKKYSKSRANCSYESKKCI